MILLKKIKILEEEEILDDSQIKARNIYVVLVNSKDQLLVEEELMDISQLREGAKSFLDNWGANSNLSDNPQKAIVSLQNDRGTSYEMYIKVQNELSAAYRELRDREAQKKFGVNYGELKGERKKEIRKMFPEKISEAEPKNVGGN